MSTRRLLLCVCMVVSLSLRGEFVRYSLERPGDISDENRHALISFSKVDILCNKNPQGGINLPYLIRVTWDEAEKSVPKFAPAGVFVNSSAGEIDGSWWVIADADATNGVLPCLSGEPEKWYRDIKPIPLPPEIGDDELRLKVYDYRISCALKLSAVKRRVKNRYIWGAMGAKDYLTLSVGTGKEWEDEGFALSGKHLYFTIWSSRTDLNITFAETNKSSRLFNRAEYTYCYLGRGRYGFFSAVLQGEKKGDLSDLDMLRLQTRFIESAPKFHQKLSVAGYVFPSKQNFSVKCYVSREDRKRVMDVEFHRSDGIVKTLVKARLRPEDWYSDDALPVGK